MNSANGFTLSHYRDLVVQTAESFTCLGFEVLDLPQIPERFAILRHDIDASPEAALQLALIEAEIGVRSTFNILLTGTMYNPLEAPTRDVLREIAALGHDIGLHFEASWHGISSTDQIQRLQEAIGWQAQTLEAALGLRGDRAIRVFSFHNTTPFTMSCRQTHYAGLRNAYAGVLQDEVEYTSDSNGYWIHRSWNELIGGRYPRVQILTHPEWWSVAEAEPAEKICREISGRALEVWRQYCSVLDSFGRTNRTGLAHAARLLPELYGESGDWIVLTWLSGRRVDAFIAAFTCLEREIHTAASAAGSANAAFFKAGGEPISALTRLRNEAVLGTVPNDADELARSLDLLALAAAALREHLPKACSTT